MCGICGFVSLSDLDTETSAARLAQMNAALFHRGPNESGQWVSARAALAARRLSILDLVSGHQPMYNEDGSVVVVYNGEIYNYLELRQWLLERGHRLQTHCDTEVISHLYEELDSEFIHKLRGMFAIALYDRARARLVICRDRVGIKPLYYATWNDALLFGSEIKSILASDLLRAELNPQALDLYLTFRYVPPPLTLFQGIFKLAAGEMLDWESGQVRRRTYWDFDFSAADQNLGEAEWIERVYAALEDAVRSHLMSDVPLGVFLSGGVDSAAVTALTARLTDAPVKTFSVSFDAGPQYDELVYARQVAKRFETDHHQVSVSAQSFVMQLPGLVWHLDEPIADPNALAQYHLAAMARQKGVIVVLSGEGSDELLAGYNYWRSIRYQQWLDAYRRLPASMRHLIRQGLESIGAPSRLRRFAAKAEQADFHPTMTNIFDLQAKKELLAPRLRDQVDLEAANQLLLTCFRRFPAVDYLNKMLYADSKLWLPENTLVKTDKATMAASVELRVPFLDREFVDLAARVPWPLKLHGRVGKYVLKRALERIVPTDLLYRPKMGFPAPVREWLRNDLREYAAEILLSDRLARRGLFRHDVIRELLRRHWSGEDLWMPLWTLLTFEVWCRVYLDREPFERLSTCA